MDEKNTEVRKLEDLDPVFSQANPETSTVIREPAIEEPAENSISNRDLAAIGAATGAVPAVIGAKRFKELSALEKMAKEIEMRIEAERLAKPDLQGRPIAQPAGGTAGQIMGRGIPTRGDKWAIEIGGPGGASTQQAQANYRMRNTLAPGETLLRSGLALPSGADVEALAKESAERSMRPAQQTMAQRFGQAARSVPSGLSSVSKFLGPNRVIGPLSGAYSAYELGQAADEFSKGQYIDAILRGIPAIGGGMMASGVPAAQLPGMALSAAPVLSEAISPYLTDLMENLKPLENIQPSLEELERARYPYRGRRPIR